MELTPKEAGRCAHRGPTGRKMAPSGAYSHCRDCGYEYLARKVAVGDPAVLELLAQSVRVEETK